MNNTWTKLFSVCMGFFFLKEIQMFVIFFEGWK